MADIIPRSSLHIIADSYHSGISVASSINPNKETDPTFDNDKSDDFEKCAEKSAGSEDEEVEVRVGDIVYRYLEFETELPTPTGIYQTPNEGQEPPPPQPDLVKYTSPFEWPESRKNMIIWISCVITSLTAFTAGAYSPGVGQMTEEWHVSNVAALAGITTFCAGFAIAPMVLAPFSEIQGRRPVFIVSGLVFVLCQLCTGLTQSYAGMLVVRFFVGVGGSTFSTMVGGVVSDIYHTSDRNKPMALFSGAALFGTGAGPLVCGFIAENTTWRWIFYMQTIVDGVMVAVIILVFKETRGSVILSRKAHALNKWYDALEAAGYSSTLLLPPSATPTAGPSPDNPPPPLLRIRWRVKSDSERSTILKMITISLYRPFHLLLTEPVVFFFSLWVAFSWAVLYLTLAAIPLLYTTHHRTFTLATSNAIFAFLCAGSILATLLSIYQERLLQQSARFKSGNSRLFTRYRSPEDRIYFACVESALMPVGLFMFGWSARGDVHWLVPGFAVLLATVGIFSIYLSVFNYLADTYHRYASSALAAQSFCRNMLGGVFPLITTQLYTRLGFGGASSLLGGIGTLLTLVPWVLVFYGPQIRARSRFASEIMHGEH